MFKMLKRLFTGEVLDQRNASISNGDFSIRLKLKRERHTGEFYVVVSTGTWNFKSVQHASLDEFYRLAAAVEEIRDLLISTQSLRPRPRS